MMQRASISHGALRADELELAGENLVCLPSGCLFWPAEQLFVVSDLHLETGSSYAGRGQLVPPYDTEQTLTRLCAELRMVQPKYVICLGDSFHDVEGSSRLIPSARAILQECQRSREWVWIAGNHDPEAPALSGMVADELAVGGITFRHEPEPQISSAEICGHLHPAARVNLGVRRVRRRCFVADRQRLMLPSFGTYTGGLSIANPAFQGLFEKAQQWVWLLGRDRVYKFPATMALGR